MRVPRWTTSLVCAGLLGAVLSGCRSREHAFRATRVPVVRFDSVLKTADSVRLPLADARLLLAVAADSTFALKAPHDTMTMTDILAWAHATRAGTDRSGQSLPGRASAPAGHAAREDEAGVADQRHRLCRRQSAESLRSLDTVPCRRARRPPCSSFPRTTGTAPMRPGF